MKTLKIAVLGSKNLSNPVLEAFIPPEATEIITGGIGGIAASAREFAKENGYAYSEILPDHESHGDKAPAVRNDEIIKSADLVIIFWDGQSRETKAAIDRCVELGVRNEVYLSNEASPPDWPKP